MKRIKYTVTSVLITLMLVITILPVYAAPTFSVSGPTSVSPGQSFSVSVSTTEGAEGSFSVSSSGGTVTGSSSIWSGESTTVKAPSSGTFTVTVTASSVSDVNGNLVNLGSKTINITVKSSSTGGNTGGNTGGSTGGSTGGTSTTPNEPTKSRDTSLKELTVSEGTLSPEFSSGKTEYEVNLPKGTEKLTISATANDSKSTAEGAGEKTLQPGENVFEIIVTAESGDKQTYKINVYVEEEPSIFLDYNDGKLGVVKSTKGVTPPDGFEQTTVKIGEEEVVSWTNSKIVKTIVYMQTEDGVKNFYLIEDGKIMSIFIPININGKILYMIDVPSKLLERSNMKYGEIEIGETKLNGWTFSDKTFKNYYLIYVMNEEGKEVEYLYETTEGTLQVYSGMVPLSEDSYNKDKKKQEEMFMYVAIGAGVASVIAIGSLIGMFKYKGSNKKIVQMLKDKNL